MSDMREARTGVKAHESPVSDSNLLTFRPKRVLDGIGLDICDHCHHSAYVDEGLAVIVPISMDENQYRFTCRACLDRAWDHV